MLAPGFAVGRMTVQTRAMHAEATKREEQWVQERDILPGQVAQLRAGNALLKSGGLAAFTVPRVAGNCDALCFLCEYI